MRLIIDGLTFHTPSWRRGVGKVFDRLLREILFHHRQDEVILTCFDEGLRNEIEANLDRAVFARIDPAIMRLPPVERAATYSARITELAGRDAPAVFWHPSPLMLDQILPWHVTLPVLATIHDFIPLRRRDLYFDRWTAVQQQDYLRRIDFLRRPDVHVSTVSASVAEDARRFLPMARDNIRAIPNAYDATIFHHHPVLAFRPGRDAPYALMVSGDDPRKNIDGFVEAFCAWRRRAASPCTLRIVCHMGDRTRARVAAITAAHDCPGAVEILGYVPDHTLGMLTKRAAFAVMPSHDEGFGLPVVEAMACGVPVVTSDIAPSREIGGDLAFYFDPASQESMIGAIDRCARALYGGRIDRDALVRRARDFDWTRAGIAYRERLRSLALPPARPGSRPKVAMLTPWPPHRSGIANSAAILAGALAPRMDLTIVAENAGEVPRPRGMGMIPPADFDAGEYDALICQMGNNTKFHSWIYDHALSPRSLVIAHDACIHPFLQHGYREGRLTAQYLTMLRNHFDAEEVARFEAADFEGIGVLDRTGLSEVARHAGAILFHNVHGRDSLLREAPDRADRLAVSPLAYGPTPLLDRTRPAPPGDGRFVLGMFGHVTRMKQPLEVLGAVQELVIRGFPVELHIVGNPGDQEEAVTAAIRRMALADHVRLTGFAGEEEFIARLAGCDVLVNLRHPSLGESSAVVYEAMYLGVPVVVSDGGSFADLPDDAVVKVPAAPRVREELARRLEELLTDPERRRDLARRGRLYTRNAASLDGYAGTVARLVAGIADRTASRIPAR